MSEPKKAVSYGDESFTTGKENICPLRDDVAALIGSLAGLEASPLEHGQHSIRVGLDRLGISASQRVKINKTFRC